MFENFIKKVFGGENPHTKHQQEVQSAIKAKQKAKAKPKAKPKAKVEKVPLTDKEKATLKKEPWVDVIPQRHAEDDESAGNQPQCTFHCHDTPPCSATVSGTTTGVVAASRRRTM